MGCWKNIRLMKLVFLSTCIDKKKKKGEHPQQFYVNDFSNPASA